MLILDAIKRKCLPDGTSLSQKSLDWLSEAALELIYCTINGRHFSFGGPLGKATFDSILTIDDLVAKVAGFTDNEAGLIGRRLVAAFSCLHNALRDTEELYGHGTVEKLKQFLAPIKDASRVLLNATDDNPMIGEMTFLMVDYLPMYRDYGFVPPASLASAIVQHLRDQYLVDKKRLVTIRFYEDISLTVCSPELARFAFLEARKRPKLEGIDKWLERTQEVFDSADAIASKARASDYLSDVINAATAAYLLYDVVRTSLGWILKQYESNGKSAPSDIYREQQVAEENLAWTGEMLEFSGHRLISTPIDQTLIRLIMTKQTPTRNILHDLLEGGMATIPVYPDVLRRIWDEILAEANGNSRLDTLEVTDLSQTLERGMRSRFAEAFKDFNFAKVALRLQDKWWTSIVEGILKDHE